MEINDYSEYFDDDSNEVEEYEMVDRGKLDRNLDIKKYDRMVKDIIASIKDKTIILTPDYQRHYLWDTKKSSKLIESILLNIPIPVIYASEEDGRWNVIDGLQRLNSLNRFYNDDFKLSGLEVLSELNGKKYSDLSDALKGKIDRGDLSIILLLESSSKDIQYDIFMRLNTGAVELNEQELRNCLYRGKLNDLLKYEMINNEDFKTIFNFKAPHKRMTDVEAILRYLSFSDSYNKELKKFDGYNGIIKNLINKFMVRYQNASDDVLNALKNKFYDNIHKCIEVFGSKAFRKPNSNGEMDSRINRPLYETIMICFEKYSLEQLINKKDEIVDKTNKLLTTPNFNDLISFATGNVVKTNERVAIYANLLEDILEK